ncbi:MAG: hypothetical protein LPK00_14435 [Bacillaceae bacterium]|nr:hypothetical protein [Bacillaceae bacterium]
MLLLDIIFSTFFLAIFLCCFILLVLCIRKKKGRKIVSILFAIIIIGKISYDAYHSIYYPAKMIEDVEYHLYALGYTQEDFRIMETNRNDFLDYLTLVEFTDEPRILYFYRYEYGIIKQVLYSNGAKKHIVYESN